MNNIQKEWNQLRLLYQHRYAIQYIKSLGDDTQSNVLNEMSYVLINIFGLESNQILEIEKNGGLTNDDLD